ncbi:MAG: glycosyltransferase [Loktanella sp.]|nr:glycosyltransferase [Loktanella sp.]
MMVSIIIPTDNRPALLQRAVASALVACPGDGEVIVVDDRSDTAVKALRSVDDHPRLRIITNTGDKGTAGARNHGVAQALGEIVMFLDDTDEIGSDYPKRVLLAAGESADWGFSARPDVETTPQVTVMIPDDVPLLDRLPTFNAGFWVKRPLFQKLGPILTDQTIDQDVDFAVRLYGHGHKAWHDQTPGCTAQKDAAPTEQPDPITRAQAYLRTFQRNQSLFAPRSPDRWALIQRCLHHAALHRADAPAQKLLRDLSPLDWRIRAWVLWQIAKRRAQTRHPRSTTHLARS